MDYKEHYTLNNQPVLISEPLLLEAGGKTSNSNTRIATQGLFCNPVKFSCKIHKCVSKGT